MRERVLIVHTGGVGDFVCALPALQRLGESAVVEIAGIPERASLAVAAGIATTAHDLERVGFHSAFTAPNDTLRAFAARFDRALVWMADPDGVLTENLRLAGISSVQCCPGIPPEDWGQPAAQWYAKGAGVSVSLPVRFDFGDSTLAPDVVLHPGSGAATKNWPRLHFEALGRALEQAGRRVTWCCGPAEEALPEPGPLLPPMSLCALGRVLSGARLFVGNDSGISHLASAAGCPTVAIFGPTSPAVWAPIGPATRIIQGQRWPAVGAVLAAAQALLGRAPGPDQTV